MNLCKEYTFAFIAILLVVNISEISGKVPDFRIGLIDSTYYSRMELKEDVPVIFYYFSPSCENCRKITTTLLKNKYVLENFQIIMITNESLNSVKNYCKKYNLNEYANIKVGTEGFTNRFLQNFPVTKLPFIVHYESSSGEGKLYYSENDIEALLLSFTEK